MEQIDILNLSVQKGFLKQLKDGQKILLSCPIYKHNDYDKKQERNFVITSKRILNLDNNQIKRKISIESIKALTIGRICQQFIIHVPSQYDYRFSAIQRKDQIIYFIIWSYHHNCKKKLPVYYKDQLSLVKYANTKQTKKNGYKELFGQKIQYSDTDYFIEKFNNVNNLNHIRKKSKAFDENQKQKMVVLSDFQPILILGVCQFGVIYLVENGKSHQKYSMKEINKENIEQYNRFLKNQLMIYQSINHPFIAQGFFLFETPNKVYLLTKFLKGGQLSKHLTTVRRFQENIVKFYALQIILGLGYLHDNNLIHRNLKLTNILLNEDGYASISGFELIQSLKEGQKLKKNLETSYYSAPEILNGQQYCKSIDWWSLGILVYQLFFGLPPFYDKSEKIIMKMIIQSQLRFSQRVHISEQGKDFINKILDKNPNKRLGNKDGMKQILKHPWLTDQNMHLMLKKQLLAPFKPETQGDSWIKNFPQQWINKKIQFKLYGEQAYAFKNKFKKS